MIPPHDEDYWSGRFEISRQDLDRAASQLARPGLSRDLKSIAIDLILGRLEHGHDPGPAAPGGLTGDDPIRMWDPAGAWQPGDGVLLVHDRFGNSRYEAYLGEVTQAGREAVEIRIDELQITQTYPRALSVPAEACRQPVSDLAEGKLRSPDLKDQAHGILLKYGVHILNRLVGALRQESRFTGLEGKWALLETLPHIDKESLQAVHHFLLQNPGAALEDILPVLKDHPAADVCLLKMAVHVALQASPDRFENTGTAARPQWKARLPSHDQACVTHFAFDPQTFEILCRPGQKLSRKKVQRLQELDLYAYVVTFPEWRPPAGR